MPPKKTPVLLARKPAMQQAVRRSMPVSPAITASVNAAAAVSSLQVPIPPSNAVSDAHKYAVLHFLALKPAKQEIIVQKTGVPTADTLNVLRKFGVQYGDEYLWKLNDRAYKFLDVWKFPYQSKEDRQFVIDNAIKAFDRQRISTSDKLWDSLLPEEQRGKGKIISKLGLHQSLITPKEQIPQRRTVAKENPESQELSNHRSLLTNIGGEPMARMPSLESIAMKKTESEARIKSIINKKPTKASTPKMPPKIVAKKDGEPSNKAGTKKVTATETITPKKRKHDQQDKLIGFATEEEANGIEEKHAVTASPANEKPNKQITAATRKIKQSKNTGQSRKTEKEFKSAERVDDSDEGLSDTGMNGRNDDTERNTKRVAVEKVKLNASAPSSVLEMSSSNHEKGQQPDAVGKLQRPTMSQRNNLREAPTTPEVMNNAKKVEGMTRVGSPFVQKGMSSKEIKQGVSSVTKSNIPTTISPKIAKSTVTKKNAASTNVGLGITLGGMSAQKGERTITINRMVAKKQTVGVQSESATKENNLASKAVTGTNTVQRPIPANQVQATNGDPATTDSSANSWASSLSAKSTPMHRQSSSQSSVSIQLSEMPPKNKKRAASSAASRKAPAAKRAKKNEPATAASSVIENENTVTKNIKEDVPPVKQDVSAVKPSPKGSSSSLSEARSITPPSDQQRRVEASPTHQKLFGEEPATTPNVSNSSPQQIAHTESVVEEYNETTQAQAVEPAIDPERVEMESMKTELRVMYAAFIKRRMEHDKAEEQDKVAILAELIATTGTIEKLTAEVNKRSMDLDGQEYALHLPRGVVLEPEVLEYCFTKFHIVREKYNAMSHEFHALPVAEQPEERRKELRDLRTEFRDLAQIVFPDNPLYPLP